MRRIPFLILILIFVCTLSCVLFACEENVDDTEVECTHTFSEWKLLYEPTEEYEGVNERKCTLCGELEYEEFPKLSESDYAVTFVAPECLTDGKKTFVSEVYGTWEVVYPKLNHNYLIIAREYADCANDGYVTYRCDNCANEYTQKLETAKGHDYKVVFTQNADCYNTGYQKCVCSVCEKETIINETPKKHVRDAGIHVDGTCSEYGYQLYTCTACGEEERVYDTEYTHNYDASTGICSSCTHACAHAFNNYKCTECGFSIYAYMESNGYYFVDGGDTAEVGEHVYFGLYPKTFVSDVDTITALKGLVEENGYYVLDGNKYVRKTLVQSAKGLLQFSDGSYVENIRLDKKDYFYLVEPMEWIVEEITDDGNILLTAQYIIDAQSYQNSYAYSDVKNAYFVTGENGAITEEYACSWEFSSLRTFLNGEFLDKTFSSLQKSLIVDTAIDNDTTNYYKSDYAKGEETLDKVFLKAFGETFDENEGYDSTSEARIKTVTDYALGSGAVITEYITKTAIYYLRSAGDSTGTVCGIAVDGSLERSLDLKDPELKDGHNYGIVPSVWIELE